MKNHRRLFATLRPGWLVAAGGALLLSLSGCATAGRPGFSHARSAIELQAVSTIASLPPEITINQLTAGGVREKRDDWCALAQDHARAVLEGFRPGRVLYADDLETHPELADEVREVRALFALIEANYVLFGLSPPLALPGAKFDFSVGSVDRILAVTGGDALLVVGGVDDIFTTDRQIMSFVSLIASAALTGQAVMPSSGAAHVSAALIARDGTVLWWNFVGDGQITDLRTREGMEATLQRVLGAMPDTLPELGPAVAASR